MDFFPHTATQIHMSNFSLVISVSAQMSNIQCSQVPLLVIRPLITARQNDVTVRVTSDYTSEIFLFEML